MNMQPVESSNIKAIGYDEATQSLRVEFRNGAVSNYDGVPPGKHAEFMASESKGQYFYRHIRRKG